MPIPKKIAAMVLFKSDRTCCVCRESGKPIQIHHIDGNKYNNKIENLAVLCLPCHTDTQIRGGFHRKLNPDLVKLYRNHWLQVVERDRLETIVDLHEKSVDSNNMELFTSVVEELRERKQYVLLSGVYDQIGNNELRDKYIEKAISKSQETETMIFLRSLQGKAKLIDPVIIQSQIQKLTANKDWSQLARLYVAIENWTEAVKSYCRHIIENVDRESKFTAAFYLKEMSIEKKLHEKLFQTAFEHASEKKDLWWQIRALQELGWNSELDELLRTHMQEIKESGDPKLLILLYKSLNDQENYAKMLKEKYKTAELKKTSVSEKKK